MTHYYIEGLRVNSSGNHYRYEVTEDEYRRVQALVHNHGLRRVMPGVVPYDKIFDAYHVYDANRDGYTDIADWRLGGYTRNLDNFIRAIPVLRRAGYAVREEAEGTADVAADLIQRIGGPQLPRGGYFQVGLREGVHCRVPMNAWSYIGNISYVISGAHGTTHYDIQRDGAMRVYGFDYRYPVESQSCAMAPISCFSIQRSASNQQTQADLYAVFGRRIIDIASTVPVSWTVEQDLIASGYNPPQSH